MQPTITAPKEASEPEPARSSPRVMRDEIIAFVTGALLIGAGLVVAFFMFLGPSTQLDPVAAWCRGWIDGLSYTDLRSGNDYDASTLDQAEAKCYARVEAGLKAPGARGPLGVDS